VFGKYNRRTLDWRIKRYGNIAGLDPIKMHAHALKHTACQITMDETDGNIMAVKTLAGHSDIGSTLVYADITTDEALKIRERYEALKSRGAVAGGRYDPR
jgi:integrase